MFVSPPPPTHIQPPKVFIALSRGRLGSLDILFLFFCARESGTKKWSTSAVECWIFSLLASRWKHLVFLGLGLALWINGLKALEFQRVFCLSEPLGIKNNYAHLVLRLEVDGFVLGQKARYKNSLRHNFSEPLGI